MKTSASCRYKNRATPKQAEEIDYGRAGKLTFINMPRVTPIQLAALTKRLMTLRTDSHEWMEDFRKTYQEKKHNRGSNKKG